MPGNELAWCLLLLAPWADGYRVHRMKRSHLIDHFHSDNQKYLHFWNDFGCAISETMTRLLSLPYCLRWENSLVRLNKLEWDPSTPALLWCLKKEKKKKKHQIQLPASGERCPAFSHSRLQRSWEALQSSMCYLRTQEWCLVLPLLLLPLITGLQGSFHQACLWLCSEGMASWERGDGPELNSGNGWALGQGTSMLVAGLWEGWGAFFNPGKSGPNSFQEESWETGRREMGKLGPRYCNPWLLVCDITEHILKSEKLSAEGCSIV